MATDMMNPTCISRFSSAACSKPIAECASNKLAVPIRVLLICGVGVKPLLRTGKPPNMKSIGDGHGTQKIQMGFSKLVH